MRLISLVLVALIGALHGYIAWFEVFAWETRGPLVFVTFEPDLFSKTVDMAANQGVYNAFLSAGLFWSLIIKDQRWQRNVAICFLIFVFVAGVFGAATITMRTFYVQSIPAFVALALIITSATRSRENQS